MGAVVIAAETKPTLEVSSMMRWVGTLCLILALAGSARAGEIVFTSGSHLAGELVNDVILVSTGSDVVEVLPEQVAVLTRNEIRLKDGRVVRGTLIGGNLKARTVLGELAINVDDLHLYRADGVAVEGSTLPAVVPAAPPAPGPALTTEAAAETARPGVSESRPEMAAADAPRGPSQLVEGARKIGQGVKDTAAGVGRTVTEGADRLHDGAKAFGESIWDAMKSIGRTLQGVFTGPSKGG